MAALDAMLILTGIVGVILLCGLFLLIGRLLDPIYRTRQMRRFLRRNWLVMYFVSKDGKTIQPRVINADEDTFRYRDNIYVVEKGKIYRKTQGSAGESVVNEGGFSFNFGATNPTKYEEGTPVIFTDNEHIKPLDFNNEESRVTPSGVGAALNAWVTNQIQKGLSGEQKQSKFILWGLIIVGILLLANVGISYKNMEAQGAATLEYKAINKAIKDACATTAKSGDTVIIEQPGVTGGG